jgi:hypothetical protein
MEAATTSLQLLTSDGRVRLEFNTALSPVQYDTLFSRLPYISRVIELRQLAKVLATQWDCGFSVELCE